MNYLNSAVNLLHAFTRILGDVASLRPTGGSSIPSGVFIYRDLVRLHYPPNQMYRLLGSMSSLLYVLEYAFRPVPL